MGIFSMNSLNQLAIYAKTPNPARTIPPNVRLTSNDTTLTIFDLFPKAKYHFLVLPRIPLSVRSPTQPDDILDIPDAAHDSITTFLASPHAAEILRELASAADEVVEMVRDEMMKADGFVWGVNVGLHAIPSMRHLHLHVISDDLVSPALKTKKHYQSFDPKHGFFLDLDDVQRMVQKGTKALPLETPKYSAMLKSDMTCFKCGQTIRDIPTLKAHLEAEWRKERKTALASAK